MPVQCEDIDFDLKIAEFRINGYAVIEDILSVETVDRIREGFLPMLKHVRDREAGFADKEWGDLHTGFGRQQHPNRYTLTIPWVKPFATPEVYENPVILEFLKRYWGKEDFYIKCFHSNNPYLRKRAPELAQRHRASGGDTTCWLRHLSNTGHKVPTRGHLEGKRQHRGATVNPVYCQSGFGRPVQRSANARLFPIS